MPGDIKVEVSILHNIVINHPISYCPRQARRFAIANASDAHNIIRFQIRIKRAAAD
jgi:hypothetical protein